MKKKVTIKDVASECGYSTFTVSSVLNNRGLNTPETCEKVLAAAKKLNYSVLSNVSAVQRIRTTSIGIVLPSSNCLTDGFYQRAISTFREAATENDFDCKLFTEQDVVKRLAQSSDGAQTLGCKGLIVFCPNSSYQKYTSQLLREGVLVALVRRDHDRCPGLLQVVDDDHAGATKLLELVHFGLNCERIIYICGRSFSKRNKSARDFAFDDFIRANTETVKAHKLIQGRILSDGPRLDELDQFISVGKKGGQKTAIVNWTDTEAAYCIGSVLKLGYRIPDDVCVTGYNDDPQASITFPSITTMRIPVEEMVADACQFLFSHMADGTMPRSRILQFEHELIVRGSTG